VTAKSGGLDPNRFDVPAGRAFELFFRSLDPAPLNVAIYRDATAADALFQGDVITDAAATYVVPALDPGEYFFRCDVHPEMTGTITAS
jgi:plastocyanin